MHVHLARCGLLCGLVTVAIGTLVSLFSRYLRGAADEVLLGLAYIIHILKAFPLIIILAAHINPINWNSILGAGHIYILNIF